MKAKALDADEWSTFDKVACALPAIGIVLGAILGRPGPGFAIGVAIWAILAIRPRPVPKPKRDPETDPVEGDVLKGYVYAGEEVWEPVRVMPGLWWQFRASPSEYNAVLRSLREASEPVPDES
jgi:hypothetical protein